jgi:hypothetical protein
MNGTYIDTYKPIFETLHQIAAHTPHHLHKTEPVPQHTHNITLHTKWATGIPKCKYTFNHINNIQLKSIP